MKVIVYLLVGAVALLMAALLVLYVLYGDSPWPAAPPRVAEGGRWLRVVGLDPEGLTVRDGENSWMVCDNFELRVSEEGGVKSLLIRGTLVKNYTREPDGRLVHSSSEELLYSDPAYTSSAGRSGSTGATSRCRSTPGSGSGSSARCRSSGAPVFQTMDLIIRRPSPPLE
jgi:hypothetical protein